MVLALVNNKGGVGKTTTAVNLAAGIAQHEHRVLLVDLDSQGSASLSLGVPKTELAPSTADVLLDEIPIQEAIRATNVEGLDLLTGSMELANADLAWADVKGREARLRNALTSVRDDYDFVLLDCPPSLSLLPINALVGSDAFIVPVVPHYLAMEGLANLMGAVERVREGMGAEVPLLGLVLTMVDYRTRATAETVNMIREHFGKDVLKTEIRVNVRLTEAPSFGQCIFQYDNSATGAEAYRQLAAEVLKRTSKAAKAGRT